MATIKNKYFPAQSTNHQSNDSRLSADPLKSKPATASIDSDLLDPLNTIRINQTDRTADIPADTSTYNPYFDTNGIQRGSAVQQQVIQNMHAESINQQGITTTYYPFKAGTVDGVWNEDPTVTFPNSFEIDMYLETYEAFNGDGKILTQYGVQFRDQITVIVAINTWKDRRDNYLTVHGDESNLETASQPREGDLLSIPFGLNAINPEIYTPKLFQITNVTTFRDGAFFQLGNVYLYRLSASLYERSAEDIQATDPITGVEKSGEDSVIQNTSDRLDLSVSLSTYNNAFAYAIGDRVIFNGVVYTTDVAQAAFSIEPGATGSTWIVDTETDGISTEITINEGSLLSSRLLIELTDVINNPATHQVALGAVPNLNRILSVRHFNALTGDEGLGVLNNNDFVILRDNTNTPTGTILFNSVQYTTNNVEIDISNGFLEIGYSEAAQTATISTPVVEEDPFASNTEFEDADDEIAVDDFTQLRWGKGKDVFGK